MTGYSEIGSLWKRGFRRSIGSFFFWAEIGDREPSLLSGKDLKVTKKPTP